MSTKTREDLLEAVKKINTTVTFKDAHLELMSDEWTASLIEFIKEHFQPDETMAKSIGLGIDETMEEMLKHVLREHLSLILVSDVSGEIIACRTLYTEKKDEPIDLSGLDDEKIIHILNFVSQNKEEMNVYKRFNVDIAIKFLTLGTHKNYRRQGIATKMFEAALLFCKELGLESVCINGEGTSNYSQRIYEKFDFEVIDTFRYDEYKVDGDIIFKNTGVNETLKVYVKQL